MISNFFESYYNDGLLTNQNISDLQGSHAYGGTLLFSHHTISSQTPKRIQNMEPPKMTLITTLGKLGDYWEVPFVGSSGGLGHSRAQSV